MGRGEGPDQPGGVEGGQVLGPGRPGRQLGHQDGQPGRGLLGGGLGSCQEEQAAEEQGEEEGGQGEDGQVELVQEGGQQADVALAQLTRPEPARYRNHSPTWRDLILTWL